MLDASDRPEGINMMGQHGSEQGQVFYSFSLNDHVPRDHLCEASTATSISATGAVT
jgi:hypothetical protein